MQLSDIRHQQLFKSESLEHSGQRAHPIVKQEASTRLGQPR